MIFNNEPYEFENLYRPLYEFKIMTVWLAAAIVTFFHIGGFTDLSVKMAMLQTSICLFMAFIFFVKGYQVYKVQSWLYGKPLEFIPIDKFVKQIMPYIKKDEFYLGEGFEWTPVQTQRAYELLKLNWNTLLQDGRFFAIGRRIKACKKKYQELDKQYNLDIGFFTKSNFQLSNLKRLFAKIPFYVLRTIKNIPFFIFICFYFFKKLDPIQQMGQPWIHGLSTKHRPLSVPANWLNGHLLILGTTGSGKTRFADLMISQCIMRGEALVIIDPKGDQELKINAKRACDVYRQYCLDTGKQDPGERFFYFHPAFPEESCRLNLLANSARDTDITTRITNLIPSQGGFDPFTAFGWLSINAIIQALLYIGENPTINEIKMHLLDGMEKLTSKAIDEFCTHTDVINKEQEKMAHAPYEKLLAEETRTAKAHSETDVCTCKCNVYNVYYSKEPEATNIASLVKLRNHPKEHFSKMINNMLPLLDMLTVGTLGTMLSMSRGDDLDMAHESINTMDIFDRKGVLYIGLDSLSDKMVGTAIGSLALSDIAASAGSIYNYRKDKPPVNVFVDEAAECVNDSFIQILNKSRGAGYRLMIATQTVSDFVSALGSDAKEEMVLGNINNVLALRTKNPTSQEFLSNDLPTTVVKTLTRTQGMNSLTTQPLLHGATQSEQLKETEAPLISPQLFGLLPNLEYIGIFAGGNIIKGKLPIITSMKAKPKVQVNKENYDINMDLDNE